MNKQMNSNYTWHNPDLTEASAWDPSFVNKSHLMKAYNALISVTE